jgi:hypothetical protein
MILDNWVNWGRRVSARSSGSGAIGVNFSLTTVRTGEGMLTIVAQVEGSFGGAGEAPGDGRHGRLRA